MRRELTALVGKVLVLPRLVDLWLQSVLRCVAPVMLRRVALAMYRCAALAMYRCAALAMYRSAALARPSIALGLASRETSRWLQRLASAQQMS